MYYPVLRWKQGEQGALQNLTPSVKLQIMPIIDFPENCSCLENRVTNFVRDAESCWGANRAFYLDLGTLDYGVIQPGTVHPALTLLQNARQHNLEIIPIITSDADSDLLSAIHQALSNQYVSRVALRVFADEETTSHLDATIAMNELELAPTEFDLIIDLSDVSTTRPATNLRVIQSLISQFGSNYRNTILVSGAFNPNIVETDSATRIHRYDFILWVQARQTMPKLQFGDYTTIQAQLIDLPYQGAPKIKYTLDQEWFVIKGHRSRARDTQRQLQSQNIVGQSFFRGPHNSFGEERIFQCANGQWGPGSTTNWVTIDVNQHITFVASQVSAILGRP